MKALILTRVTAVPFLVYAHSGDIDKEECKKIIDLHCFQVTNEDDTPEKRQPYGSKAKQALSDMVFGKHIKAKIETVDRYGRYVADIHIDGKHVNAELIRVGAALVHLGLTGYNKI